MKKDEAIKLLREALEKIANTPYRIYDGNRPYISDHDSGYAMGIAAGHQLAANWAQQALSATETIDDGWQPIESAPRDGTNIVVCGGYYYVQQAVWASYHPNAKGETCWRTLPIGGHKLNPTHWKPLPPPPKRGE